MGQKVESLNNRFDDDSATVKGPLNVEGNVAANTKGNTINLTSNWQGTPDSATNIAEISNDTGTYKTLMLVGNRSAGGPRRVSVYDKLEVNGNLTITGSQNKLEVDEQSSANVRCANLNIGHSSRRGSLGRALVDNTNTLVLNYATDWRDGVFIYGNTRIDKSLNVDDDLTFGTLNNRKFVLHSRGGTKDFLQITYDNASGNWDYNQGITLRRGGNVGIGVNGPGGKLHVRHIAQNGNGGALIIDAPGSPSLRMGVNTTYAWVQSHGARPLYINELSNHTIINRASGNVGIGTTNPVEKLHVASNARIGSSGEELKIGYVGHSNWAGIAHASSATTGKYALMQSSIGTTLVNAASGRNIHFREANNDRMVLRSGGNVGIGTTTPSHKLEVKGGDNVALFESTGTSAYIRLHSSEGFNNRVEFCNRSGGRAAIWVATAGDAFNVLKNGRVGIGTITPAESLDINGKLRVTNSDNYWRAYIDNNSRNKGLVFHLRKSHHGGQSSRYIIWNGDANWDQFSDKKLKTNIKPVTGILDKLVKLQVKTFNWKDNPEGDVSLGFTAQEVQPLFPDLVGTHEEPNIKEQALTLKYTAFGTLAVGAIKELKTVVDDNQAAMKKQLAAMKKQITELKKQLTQLKK